MEPIVFKPKYNPLSLLAALIGLAAPCLDLFGLIFNRSYTSGDFFRPVVEFLTASLAVLYLYLGRIQKITVDQEFTVNRLFMNKIVADCFEVRYLNNEVLGVKSHWITSTDFSNAKEFDQFIIDMISKGKIQSIQIGEKKRKADRLIRFILFNIIVVESAFGIWINHRLELIRISSVTDYIFALVLITLLTLRIIRLIRSHFYKKILEEH